MLKLSKLIAASLFTTLLTGTLTTKAEEHPLIGINHPPFSQEIEEFVGWTIESPYSIDQVSFNGQELLLLNRLIKIDSQGDPVFEVVNVLPLPIIYETETIKGSGSMCTVNGQEDPNIIVVVKIENKPKLTKVSQAWRVENEKFNEIDIQGLSFECENFGYGL